MWGKFFRGSWDILRKHAGICVSQLFLSQSGNIFSWFAVSVAPPSGAALIAAGILRRVRLADSTDSRWVLLSKCNLELLMDSKSSHPEQAQYCTGCTIFNHPPPEASLSSLISIYRHAGLLKQNKLEIINLTRYTMAINAPELTAPMSPNLME